MIVCKTFSFAAAHFLTKYHGKCERLHGHNYRLSVAVSGPIGENGMVVDFVLLKKLVAEKIIDHLDHFCLNDFFENPTAENLAKWIWDELSPLSQKISALIDDPNFPAEIAQNLRDAKNAKLDRVNPEIVLHEIILWETDDSFVIYRGK